MAERSPGSNPMFYGPADTLTDNLSPSSQLDSLPVTRDQPSSLPFTTDQPSSLPFTRDQPRSLPFTRDQPSSLPVMTDQPSSLPVTRDQPSNLYGSEDDHSGSAKLCQNGLQFSVSGINEIQYFTYATLPGVDPTPLDWKVCSSPDSDVPSEHVIYYQLTTNDESLLDVVKEYCDVDPNVVGLIVVNFTPSNFLPVEILERGIPKRPPICVVSLEDGERIVDFFNTQVNDMDVKVAILAESNVDSGSSGLKSKHSRGKLLKFHDTGSGPLDFYHELKKLMLNSKKERIHILATETANIQLIFSCFQNYENKPKRDAHDKVITKLRDNVKDDIFHKDFLFYLLVAHRFVTYYDLYNSGDAINSYLLQCIEKFEAMTDHDMQKVVDVMLSFVQRGNFTVQWYHFQKADCAIFTLLYHMAETMLSKSVLFKPTKSAIYQRILWIGVNIFFGLQCKIDPATLSSIWLSGLINEKVLGKLEFSEGTVTDFMKGFKFCELLQLPRGVFFDASSFASLLDPIKCKGLHFSHITKIIEAGACHLHWDSGFLFCFMPPIRSHYEALFKKHKERNVVWDGCSGDGTKSGVYKEAVQFLECMVKVSIHETDTSAAIGLEVQKFLEFLVNNVDFKADNAVECLKELRNSRLPKKYSTTITNAVNLKGMAEMQQLKLTQICKLFKSLNIWQFQFVEKFLNEYTISVTVDLKDPSWSTLLAEIVSRFSTITCKQCIVGLLNRAGKAYKICKNQNSFVTDLLKLNVPKLLFVPEDVSYQVEKAFSDMIQSFIQENGLQQIITEQAVVIVDAVKPGNHFHVLLLKAVQKEITPTAKMIENAANNTMKDLIIRSSEHISKTFTASLPLSDIAKFYWSFIALCCKRIQIGVKDLKKLAHFSFAIEKLCIIYLAYCDKTMDVSQPLCKVPEEISDIKEYFNWIIKMQGILKYWYELFEQQNYNFDDIITYAGMLATTESLARSLNITNMVHEIDHIEELKTKYYEQYIKLCTLIVKDAEGCVTIMQMLDFYGIKLNHTLQEMLKTHVVLPGDDPLVHKSGIQHALYQGHHQHEKESEKHLLLKRSVTSKTLARLIVEVKEFVKPMFSELDFFLYFYLHNCEVFSKYLNYQLATTFYSSVGNQESFTEADDKMKQFADALKNTKKFILSLIEGIATYEEIEKSLGESLLKLEVDREFKIICGFPEFQKCFAMNEEGKEGIKNMLGLFQCSQQISYIPKVCEQYHLENCLNDDKLTKLKEITSSVSSIKDKAKITGKDATEYMKHIWETLTLKNFSEAKRCLKIFPAVAKCPEFYKFVKGKGFTGKTTSRSAFKSQINLITAQLQHEPYNETVLNHLSQAFEYIVPFLDPKQDLSELMAKIVKLFNDKVGFGHDHRKDFCQLETVNSNITMIQLWFSRTEGDTVANVSKELECIMNTGHFKLVIVPSKATQVSLMDIDEENNHSKVLLYYEPINELFHRKYGASESSVTDVSVQLSPPILQKQRSCSPEIWNSEQIYEFVRKLGFLEAENLEESEESVRIFQRLNQSAQAVYNTMLKLKSLGHPHYLEKTEIIYCNNLKDAQEKVKDAENKLKDWKTEISSLYKTYNKLLFFSVSKVLLVYEALTKNYSADKVMQEIGFLFESDDETRKTLKEAVENSRVAVFDHDGLQSNETPVIFVGKYLEHLCSDKDGSVKKYFLHSRSQPSRLIDGKTILPSQEIVHYAPNYDNGQLLRLLIEIYNGVPESYEVFHCSEDSTEEDLKLFLQRSSVFKHYTFTILEVNKLPYRLQEVILHHHSQRVQEIESPCNLNYIETNDSVLHEMPWVVVKEYKPNGPCFDWPQARAMCENFISKRNPNFTLELVYGCAGDGKTHYIEKNQLVGNHMIIAVNEAFSVLNTISKLRMLPTDQNCTIHFNFTFIPPSKVHSKSKSEEKSKYETLMDTLAWFFFKLLIFGYVEDLETGIAFQLPGGLHWKIFVEVPSHAQQDADISLKLFLSKIPVFNIVGKSVCIDKTRDYDIDESVQLVCKYLHAFENRNDDKKGINKLYVDATKTPVTFGSDPDLKEEECYHLLNKYMSQHVASSKVLQKLFVKYMERRCKFLERFPAFNYNSGCGVFFDHKKVTPDELNRMIADEMLQKLSTVYYTNTSKLGEVLMETMLKEVSEFCKDVQQDWATQEHQQLIYEVTEGSGTIHLITLKPDSISKEKAMKFKRVGIAIPTLKQLMQREQFDSYLSCALNVPLNEENEPHKVKRLKDIDESHYVLTLDYTMKMLNIHERRQCGIPVIIEGETGVGKTALIEMLSKLWNHALINDWRTVKQRIVEQLYNKSHELEDNDLENSLEQLNTNGWHFDKQSQSQNRNLSEADLIPLLNHTSQQSPTPYFKSINKQFLQLINTAPILELIEVDVEAMSSGNRPVNNDNVEDYSPIAKLIEQTETDSTAQATAKMICTILNGNLIPTFYKLNIHAALTPKKIKDFFAPIIKLATSLKNKAHKIEKPNQTQELLITVFLDELNTSSYMGLFKEMMVDKSFEGEPLPSNIFLIAACNPHRGNSLVAHGYREDLKVQGSQKDDPEEEAWFRGSYYVQKLHPTLKFLMWNYGSLNDEQEKDYIKEKMIMVNKEFDKVQNIAFSKLVVKCQGLIRQFASEQLRKFSVDDNDANLCATSCVSQRDIQRVFTFYCWIIKTYENLMKPSTTGTLISSHPMIKDRLDPLEKKQRALLVSLGLVYYMRLDSSYRLKFVEEMDRATTSYSVKFKRAFNDEMNFYIKNLILPAGIAKTEALKENLFATIICTVTNTPLIIVGAPGSSKTLSFNLTISNLKGPESEEDLFRNIDVFKSLDPHYYQCSRRTTSIEIETVFHRAINRQRSHDSFSMPIRCVVFMDEAGLPEESHESLKVLHYHLDDQEVAFVGITNHVLDAAKTNRAVSLFRPTASQGDLETLAIGCLCINPDKPAAEIENDRRTVRNFCAVYYQIMQDNRFKTFFGLRDFIHFINYIRRKRQSSMSSKLVLQSLERNFNGTDYFTDICTLFMEKTDTTVLKQRTIVEILCKSLADKPYSTQAKDRSTDGSQNEVRYKLIIDPSKDESITRLLFMFGILKSENTRTFMCSNFPGDSQLQKINTIAAIMHSAIEGYTVIMSQTDDIHESFYDLFNQHFRRIDDPEVGPRYFTNIAIGAHTKPSRVHEKFQCIVVIKESEIKNTPAPFLNRFEKYSVSYTHLLNLVLDALPPCLRVIVNIAHKKVNSFFSLLDEGSALYGAVKDTISSLLLSILPRPNLEHQNQKVPESFTVDGTVMHKSNATQLLHTVQKFLHKPGGFCCMESNTEELEYDASIIIQLLANTGSQFSKVAKNLDIVTPDTISQWISEAMELAYTGDAPPKTNSGKSDEYDILGASDGACMVTALITQWLVRFMCKKLMQLMTPETLILKRKSIPISYLKTYLSFQSHFSINELITQKIKMLDQCDGDQIATKIICYTRSSSLIHQLPTVYPRSTDSTAEDKSSKQYIETLICEKAENVMLCKLSGISSQTSFKQQLQCFKSSQQEIFVLIVNMKETEPEVINHIRIMVEEVEFLKAKSKKLFVLLLHFPPTMFYKPCYPALFLYGWDHYYLDTIGHFLFKDDQLKEVPVVNVREWLTQSCLSEETETNSMCNNLQKQLQKPESIQVIASRVLLSSQLSLENAPDIGTRYGDLKKLLIDKKVGSVLCCKFRSYWKPSVIGNHLEQAAMFCKSRESTLSISDSVDSVCKATFLNFIAYMIYQISKSHNLQLLFSSHCDDATLDLFHKLLNVHPVPELPEVKACNYTLDCRIHNIIRKLTSIPKFPFFKEVSTFINNLVQQNVDRSNEEVTALQDEKTQDITTGSSGLPTKEQIFKKLYISVCSEIEVLKANEVNMTGIAIMEMQNNEEIWKKYYNDFVNQYLHMTGAPDDIEHKLLQLTLTGVLDNYKEMKAVALHCYVHLYQLDIAKVVALLKPLGKLKDKIIRDEKSVYPADPQQSLFVNAQASKSVQESIVSKYVIDCLFVALIDILYHRGKKLPLFQEWYILYRDLISLGMLKTTLTTIMKDNKDLKAKYHVTQTAFIILQLFDCVTDVTADCACVMAAQLCNKFFNSKFQLKNDEPLNLESIVKSFDIAVQGPQFADIVEKQLCHYITDGLFMQFFPESMKTTLKNEKDEPYHKEDIEFFVKFANDLVPLVLSLPTSKTQLPMNGKTYSCISLSKYKLYLDNILSRGWNKDYEMLKPLNFYKCEVCICIGETILSQYVETIPNDLRYVPPYLQQTSRRKLKKHTNPTSLMHPKLAHLYFYTVLERLQTCEYTTEDLITLVHTIDQKDRDSSAERVISVIEREALIEILLQVIVKSFPVDKDDDAAMKALLDISDDINCLVTTQSHYDIMLMHLIEKYGPRGVLNKFSEEKKEWWNSFQCFQYVKEILENTPSSSSHLFPFIVGSKKTKHQFTSMYKEICGNLCSISEGDSQAKQTKFLNYVQSVIRNGDKSYDKVSSLRMMIWLCVYYEFYCKKKHCRDVILLLEKSKDVLKLTNEHINVLTCFLDPTKMIKIEEISNPLNYNDNRLELTSAGEVRRIIPSGNVDKHDAIWKFFNPRQDYEDPSDTDLRHALANMIAVVFALPSRSNHIWYHMFCPGELEDSHMTGFMYTNTVKKGGLMYDCGCELDEDGQYGRKDYARTDTLSLPLWYLMLWTNFGAFCVGLVTQPNVMEQLNGHILSDQMSIREYCMAQLKFVWLYMRTNLKFVGSDDERSFFIMKSMYMLLMLYQDGKLPFSKGRFDDLDSLNTYETTWNTCIYEPSKANLQVELENHSSDSMWKLPAFQKYRTLNQQYPYLATKIMYNKNLVAAREAHKLNDTHLVVLHRFTWEYDKLLLGGALLPDLVEFYQWIHTHLSHLVTYERALNITIGDVIRLSAKRYSPKLHEHLTSLYHNFSKKYNDYVKISGGIVGEATCDRTSKPTDAKSIDDKTPLIKFLSHESEDITKYHDWLYFVLMDIVENHNSYLISVYEQSKHSKCHYQKYLPDSPPESHATEVTSQSCIVPSDGGAGKQQFLKLVKSCYMYSGVQCSPLFDLDQLEQNVVAFYIAGKPRIQLEKIRTIFRFRNSPNETTLGNSPGCAIDISSVAQELPSQFKEPIQEEKRKELLYHFRTATFTILNKVSTGLRNILGHLNQDILQHKSTESLLTDNLGSFLTQHFKSDNLQQVFHEIGIQTESVNDLQLVIFEDIELKRLYSCLVLFVEWLQGGLYDFSSLPITVFKYMEPQDQMLMEKINEEYSSKENLISDLDEFETTLKQAETYLTSQADPRISLIQNIVDTGTCEETDSFVALVPRSILTYNYVHFRMTLRKLKLKMTMMVDSQPQDPSTVTNKWSEIIEDLWKDLPHFQDDQQLYDKKCLESDCVKLQFGDDTENQSDDIPWIQCDLPSMEKSTDSFMTNSVSQAETTSILQKIEDNPEIREVVMQKLLSSSPAASVTSSMMSLPEPSIVLPEQSEVLSDPSDAAKKMTTDQLCEWLESIDIDDEYIQCFKKARIKGKTLAVYDDKDLEEDGISVSDVRKKILVEFRNIK